MASSVKEPETTREEEVNVHLALLLSQRGLKAKAERRSRQGVPDVRVTLRSFLILLECKWEGSESSLEAQLQERRAAFPEALAVLGVLYPERLKHAEDTLAALEEADDLQWWQASLPTLLDLAKDSPTEPRRMSSGSVDDLADHLRILPLDLQGVDQVQAAAGSVEYALEQAAYQLARHERIAGRIADIIAETDQEKNRAAALRIGCLALFNALAFQDRLAKVNKNVETALETSRQDIASLQSAWQYICDNIDYVPVFGLAADILDVLQDGPADVRTPVIAPLIKAVDQTEKVEGHDLSGRLFHTLLSDAKFTGAYYTSVPAATLLTRIAFHEWPAGVDWGDHEFPASLNVADLACGTGTLLMAVAAEAERRHTAAGGKRSAALHKAMVEQALHGYDVQLSAVHFAATSLAMLNPHIEFDHMNLVVMPLGDDGERVSLGSLDFLGSSEAIVQYALSRKEKGEATGDVTRVTGSESGRAEEAEKVKLPKLDLAIMNPPFTRSSLMFGSLPTAERRAIQEELKRRLQTRRASAIAGMGAAFVAAVSPSLRPGEGRLALVLPLTVCTGRSWAQTRALIEQDYSLDMVISSHDPQRWNFSDSTALSEALLIATRRARTPAKAGHRTTFVNLWQNPDGVLDAHRVAQAVTATTPAQLEETGTALLAVDGQHIGEAVSIAEADLSGKQWFGVQFARADVTRSATRLFEKGEVWIPGVVATASVQLRRLGAICSIGPDRRDILDGFEQTDSVTAYPMVVGNDTEQRKRMTVEPDKYLAPLAQSRPGRRLKQSAQLWQGAARLIVAERLRLDTARVVAMRSESKVLSNVWWEVQVEDATTEKALAVWLNSSLGLLTIAAQRTSTEGGWVAMKKADLKELPVLDPRCLSASQLHALSRLFDSLATAEFERLPNMAHCPARQALDDGISQILDLPDLSTLRHLLASEPVISNRRL
ncbi:MAG: hypothetical protein OXE05_09210 [Chloroflexi bacterium]|nr:hypothetical protein [Chloroflexota bacterium]